MLQREVPRILGKTKPHSLASVGLTFAGESSTCGHRNAKIKAETLTY
jgi:hypothetical protein